MNAAVVEGPGKLVVRDVPDPRIGEFDCLCDNLYGATCSGTDLHIIANHKMPFPIEFPTMLGHETIGRVIEVGPKVRYLKPGDLVTRVINPEQGDLKSNWGGFAERGVAADHRAMLEAGIDPGWSTGIHRVLPEGTDPAKATMIITWRETFSFISRIGVRVGSSVLVIGSGANGLAFANHASNFMAGRVAMIGSAKRREAAARVGVTDYLRYDAENLIGEARGRGLDGFDLIIDALGRQGVLSGAIPLLKSGGTVSVYGMDSFGDTAINPMQPVSFTVANSGYQEGEGHDPVMRWLEAGWLRAENYLDLDRVFPLEAIGEAFEAVRRRELIKAVVRLDAKR